MTVRELRKKLDSLEEQLLADNIDDLKVEIDTGVSFKELRDVYEFEGSIILSY